MAVTPEIFLARKRRPSAASFISPNFSATTLIRSIFLLSKEISSFKPLQFILKRNSLSIIRKSKILAGIFEELLRNQVFCSHSAQLCFEEMYIVLQRIKTLIEDCSNGSRIWQLMQIESVSFTFHELISELSTLLDIFPLKDFDLSEDVKELVILVTKQCAETEAFVDLRDDNLRREVLNILDGIKREIAPDHSRLKEIFEALGFQDSSSCRDEIERLEDEIQNQFDERSKSYAVSLIGLVRYAKCVFYGPSTPPRSDFRRHKSVSELNIPADFRCPITLELMRDPVIVSTGQTYDRMSINLWIESGHNTCPKTGQTLAHTELIPNRALKNIIAMWCREQKITYEVGGANERADGRMSVCKAVLELTKMTVSFLIKKLSTSSTIEDANGIVYELRVLAKSDSTARPCIAEAGAIPKLVRYLGSDIGSEHANLQVNAVTTILNLSILEENKTRIMETDGALNGVIEVLRSGATWEAKGNAAATLFSLSGVHAYKKRLGRKTRVVKGLIDLAREGCTSSKRDALVAILTLGGERENVVRFVEGGVVEAAAEAIGELPEEAVAVLETVVRRGGLMAVAAAYNIIKKLGEVLREGGEATREGAAATLVTICRKGGTEMVAEMAGIPGIERVIWELIGTGTTRGRRKAASLMRYLRRWGAGLDHSEDNNHNHSVESHSITIPASSRIF